MVKEQMVKSAYDIAKERYAAVGVDTEAVIEKLGKISLSMHCWQADDVTGFENPDGQLTGGIQATGNYPGKARNIEELRADILKAASLVPGQHRLSLHAIYGDFGGKFVDRDQLEPKHFESWMKCHQLVDIFDHQIQAGHQNQGSRRGEKDAKTQ